MRTTLLSVGRPLAAIVVLCTTGASHCLAQQGRELTHQGRHDFSNWRIHDCPDLTDEEAKLIPRVPSLKFKIGIEDGVFTKDGKPYFLLGTPTGGGQWEVNSDWFPRVFKFDFVTRGDSGFRGLVVDADRGTLNFRWRTLDWWATHVNELHRNNLAVWTDHANSYKILQYVRGLKDNHAAFPSIDNMINRWFGHYYSFDHNNPLGRRLYRNDSKAYLRYCRGVDFLAIELFNEIGYACYSPLTLDAFRAYAKDKYGGLREANRVWRTEFRDWGSARPPHLWEEFEGWSFKRYTEQQSKAYPELWNDWIEFLRGFFVKGLKPMVASARELNDRNPRITVQARFQTGRWSDYMTIDMERIVPQIDFIAHQVSTLKFYNNGGRPMTIEHFKDPLARLGLYHDYGRALCDKPLLNSEGITNGNLPCEGSDAHMAAHSIVPLHTTWRFKTDPKRRGLREGWHKAAHDERAWDNMPIPGPWEKHEAKYAKYDGWAWYKTRFVVPKRYEHAKEDGSVHYFFVGGGLDDEGTFYLNDERILHSKGGQPNWRRLSVNYQVEVSDRIRFGQENTLSLLIHDTGRDGGPLGFMALIGDNDMAPRSGTTPGQLAHLYWSTAVRGFSGINHWLCWDEIIQTDIPRIKTHIDSVAPVLLPRPRIKGKVALMYSFESFMGLLTMQTGAADLLDYYGSPMFHQVPLDILSNRQLIAGGASAYPLLLIPYAHTVRKGSLTALRDYVINGGHVVMTYNSFLRNDWHYESLPRGELIGARIGSDVAEGSKVIYKDREYPVAKGSLTGKFGVVLEPVKAQTVAAYDNGKAAVSYRRLGKGGIWYVGAELAFAPIHRLIGDILDQLDIRGDVQLSFARSEEYPYVEAQVIGGQARFLLYLVNWGGARHAFDLKFERSFLTGVHGGYFVRELQRTDSPLHKQTLSLDGLLGGIHLDLEAESPRVILFESTNADPLQFAKLSANREAIMRRLAELKRERPVMSGKPAVMFLVETLRPGNSMSGKMATPVFVQLLEDHGFQVHDVDISDVRPEVLKRFQVAIILEDNCNWWNGLRKTHPQVYTLLQEFVENGGGLLAAGTGYVHGNAASVAIRQLLHKYGVGHVSAREAPYCRDPRNCAFGDPIQVTLADIVSHPVTAGVRRIQAICARPLADRKGRLACVVKSAASDLNAPSAPVVLAGAIGKGRVVVCGDSNFAQPLRIELADNAQFALNCVTWLSGRTTRPSAKAELARSFFISEAAMRAIESEESRK